MADLGTAYVNIVPKAPGISDKIESVLNEGGSGAENAGKSFGKKILSGLGALGIGAAVGNIFKQAFEAGGDLQQSFGGLETLYGDAADGAKEYARQAAQAGISANTFAEQAVSFGASLREAYGGDTQAAMEAANTAILDMADNAAKMGTPIENIQAAYQGFAKGQYQLLDNLKLGYGGTKTEMERLLADAEAFSGVHYDIDNLGDVYAAIHVIQGELGLTGVAAAEAQTTLSGSMAALKASWENVMGALATGEGLETAMDNLMTSVGSFAENVLTIIQNIGPQLPDLILGLVDILIDNAPEFIAGGAEMILQLGVGLIGAIPDLVAKLPEIWNSLKNTWNSFDWASLGSDIINGVISGLWSGATWLYRSVRNIISNALSAGQGEAETGSPSKLFARELGQWIPAGVAMGVEDNMDPLDRAMRGMIDGSLTAGQDYRAPRQTAASDADRIIAALQRLQLQADVHLEGDANKLFKVIRSTNNNMARAATYNPLGARV